MGEGNRWLCGFRPWKIIQITWDAGVVVDEEDRKWKFVIMRGVNLNVGSARAYSFLLVNLNH